MGMSDPLSHVFLLSEMDHQL